MRRVSRHGQGRWFASTFTTVGVEPPPSYHIRIVPLQNERKFQFVVPVAEWRQRLISLYFDKTLWSQTAIPLIFRDNLAAEREWWSLILKITCQMESLVYYYLEDLNERMLKPLYLPMFAQLQHLVGLEQALVQRITQQLDNGPFSVEQRDVFQKQHEDQSPALRQLYLDIDTPGYNVDFKEIAAVTRAEAARIRDMWNSQREKVLKQAVTTDVELHSLQEQQTALRLRLRDRALLKASVDAWQRNVAPYLLVKHQSLAAHELVVARVVHLVVDVAPNIEQVLQLDRSKEALHNIYDRIDSDKWSQTEHYNEVPEHHRAGYGVYPEHAIVALYDDLDVGGQHRSSYLGHVYSWLIPESRALAMIGIRGSIQNLVERKHKSVAPLLLTGLRKFATYLKIEHVFVVSPLPIMRHILRQCNFVVGLDGGREPIIEAIAKTWKVGLQQARMLFDQMGKAYYIMTAHGGGAYNTPKNMSCTDPLLDKMVFDIQLSIYS